jgi:hypothetical protein
MRAFEMRSVRQLLMVSVAVLLLATGTAHADDAAIRICDKRFQAGELQPGGRNWCLLRQSHE